METSTGHAPVWFVDPNEKNLANNLFSVALSTVKPDPSELPFVYTNCIDFFPPPNEKALIQFIEL